MKKITIKSDFVMNKEEIEQLKNLPDNLPETKLTTKQKEFVSALYRKYITKIDHQSWAQAMYKAEQSEKWPSGPRVKEHEAKRMILSNLLMCNEYHNKMTFAQSVCLFHSALTCRPMYAKLIYEIYNVSYKY
jgi:hypothetical protein